MSKQNNMKSTEGAPKVAPVSTGGGNQGQKSSGATILQLGGGCLADTCKKKSEKAGFCMEHFDWFKEGLITKEGRKPSDFEKKFFSYQQRRRPAA